MAYVRTLSINWREWPFNHVWWEITALGTSLIDLGNRAEANDLDVGFPDEFEVAALDRTSHHSGDAQLHATRSCFELLLSINCR